MSKLKLFLENFLVYGFGGIISRVVPLLMVPIVTRLIPDTAHYGLSDLCGTITSLFSSLAILGMYDAMYRMFFEKDDVEYKKKVCSTTLLFTLGTSLVVALMMLLLRGPLSRLFFGDTAYAYLVYIASLSTFVGSTNAIISAPTRMRNKWKIFLITNTLTPVLSYTVSIPLLLRGQYILALPVAGVVSGITLESAFWLLNRDWFRLSLFDRNLLKKMLLIALPMVPNFLVYWLFNSSDRVMIANLLSTAAEGIYSAGSKLGHASNLIYTAFAGGWQYFAFSTMREENQVESNSIIFEYLGIISFVCASLICAWSFPIYRLLFVGNYVRGYVVSPYLFLAPLLQMLFQVACNQFLVVKKTWPNLFILSFGAFLNVALNFLLIPRIGIEGAAIATLLGYLSSDIIACAVLMRMKLMTLSGRFVLCSGLLIGYFLIWRLCFRERAVISTLLALALTAAYVFLYRADLERLLRNIRKLQD